MFVYFVLIGLFHFVIFLHFKSSRENIDELLKINWIIIHFVLTHANEINRGKILHLRSFVPL